LTFSIFDWRLPSANRLLVFLRCCCGYRHRSRKPKDYYLLTGGCMGHANSYPAPAEYATICRSGIPNCPDKTQKPFHPVTPAGDGREKMNKAGKME